MRYYHSPFGRVALADERLQHILRFHPDVASCVRFFGETLEAPERTGKSVHDPDVIICYRYLPRRRRFLAIVIKTGDYPFVLTAYIAKKTKRGTL